MATVNWIGGATAVTQVDTITVADTWATSDTVTVRLFAEDGSTAQTVTSTATGATIETNVIDVMVSDLTGSTNTLFTKVTFAKASASTITATAKTGGIPFHMVVDYVTAGDGEVTVARTTLSEGANDYWVDGSGSYSGSNWMDTAGAAAVRPVDADNVKVVPHPSDKDAGGNPKSYAILYHLGVKGTTAAIASSDTSGAAIRTAVPVTLEDLNSFRAPEAYRANIGDPVGGYYLKVDCTSNGGSGTTVLKSSGMATWISGTHTLVEIKKVQSGGEVRLDGGTSASPTVDVNVLGGDVQGTVRIKDACIVTNLNAIGCQGAKVKVGTGSVGLTALRANAADIEVSRPVTTATTWGTAVVTQKDGVVTDWDNYGAYVWYNGDNDIGSSATAGSGLTNWSGTFDFSQNQSVIGINVFNSTIYDGTITDQGGLAVVTYYIGSDSTSTEGVTRHGGSVASQTATVYSFQGA